jgi:hypothetical protein
LLVAGSFSGFPAGPPNAETGRFWISKAPHSGGVFFSRFSALYIAREKGGGASAEVMVGAWVRIVRRGDFRDFRKLKKSASARSSGKLPETKFACFRQGEFSGQAKSWLVVRDKTKNPPPSAFDLLPGGEFVATIGDVAERGFQWDQLLSVLPYLKFLPIAGIVIRVGKRRIKIPKQLVGDFEKLTRAERKALLETAAAARTEKEAADIVARGIKRRAPDGTEIKRIGSRFPINSKYAGKVMPASELPPALRKKYPSGVAFTSEGFPIFKPHAIAEVKVAGLTGNRRVDERKANNLARLKGTPRGYTWHHHEEGVTMQLVARDLHEAVRHTGGSAVIEHAD